ncbi:MAG: nucleotide pyrophosphohydrolase [Bacilli bacterium]|nr:nucleotide pyrophosphohydrolase [Bacilli bacterium]
MNQEIIARIRKFVADRDWDQFHTGSNLAKSIVIEAAELLEVFQWSEKERSVEKVEEELADVLTYCYMLADKYGIDVDKIVMDKMAKNEEKYPPDLCRGSSKKYNEIKSK